MEERPDETVVVTTASRSATEDRRLRRRRYAQLQGLRLVSFVLAVVLPVPTGVKLVLIAAALVLPWMGVVGANGGPRREHRARPSTLIDRSEPTRIALDPARDVEQ